MPVEYKNLTVYAIRDQIDGTSVSDFHVILDPEKEVIEFAPIDFADFTAQLFVLSTGEKRPAWVDFLESGFGEIEDIIAADTFSALLAVRTRYRKDLYFAFTFGYSGRHMLRPDAYKRSYGLRTALNSLYPSHAKDIPPDYGPIRSITAKTVSTNTLHTLRQTDRSAAFEQFGVDIQRDLLGAVTGVPYDQGIWGTRISGGDPVYLHRPTRFVDLGSLCKQIERTSRREDYKAQFSWIDNVRAVEDPLLKDALWDELLSILRNRDIEHLELVVPSIVDWNAIDSYRITPVDLETRALSIQAFLDSLEARGDLRNLQLKHLKGPTRLELLRDDGSVLEKWPLYYCLSGQIEHDRNTYLVSQGEFYTVEVPYLNELDAYLRNLTESTRRLPAAPQHTHEGDYSSQVALASPDLLLLDKATVRISIHTTEIEICDLLSLQGEFIHIKRKLGSSALSHLFSQGFVSAELLMSNAEFRQLARGKIREQELVKHGRSQPPSFSILIRDPFVPSDYTIVFAIHADWRGRSIVQALPFFSKVNLRRTVEDLKRMGYPFAYIRIHI